VTFDANGLSAVVFDLDGTLIDSVPDLVATLNRLLADEGRRLISLDEGRQMIGEGARALVERGFIATGDEVGPAALDDLTHRYVAIYRAEPVVETIIFPGVVQVLKLLADSGVAMGVCTNKPDEMSRLVLEALGLADYFGAVIGGDALPVRKPDGGHLNAVVARLAAKAESTIYVGDSITDAQTAHNAGIPFIAVTYGYSRVTPEDFKAAYLIDSFAALPAALMATAKQECT
jgi:phosphoglycolate phosphatase